MAIVEFINNSEPYLNAENLNNNFNELSNNIDELNDDINAVDTKVETALARGYVEESGSNANGSYIKYSDGTMICYKTLTGTTDISTAWGSLYTSATLDLGYWPVFFISRPAIMINTQNQTGTQFMLAGQSGGGRGTLDHCGATTLIRPNSRTGVAYQLDIIGIGKWK